MKPILAGLAALFALALFCDNCEAGTPVDKTELFGQFHAGYVKSLAAEGTYYRYHADFNAAEGGDLHNLKDAYRSFWKGITTEDRSKGLAGMQEICSSLPNTPWNSGALKSAVGKAIPIFDIAIKHIDVVVEHFRLLFNRWNLHIYIQYLLQLPNGSNERKPFDDLFALVYFGPDTNAADPRLQAKIKAELKANKGHPLTVEKVKELFGEVLVEIL